MLRLNNKNHLAAILYSQATAGLVPIQSMGVKTMEERKDDQDRKGFQDDISYFLSKESFNMFDFHERVLVSIHYFFLCRHITKRETAILIVIPVYMYRVP